MAKAKLEYLAKVTTGGRITIPVKTRKEKGIEKGDFVWIRIQKPSFEGSKEKTDEEAEKRK